jgi:hypothetical protein
MILFASSGCVNSIIMDDADFVGADLESHPIYDISDLSQGYKGFVVLK